MNKNKRFSYKDKRRSSSKQRNENYTKNDNKKKYNSDVKVLSTNIVSTNVKKELKQVDVKKGKPEGYNRSQSRKDDVRASFFKKNQNKSNNQKIKRQISNEERERLKYYRVASLNKEKCAKCQQTINDMASAICDKNNAKCYHFDCVVNDIKKDNQTSSKERVVYLGSGSFGVIENSGENNSSKFIIKKKIQFVENL